MKKTLLLATYLVGAGGSLASADEVGMSVSTATASDTDGFVLPKGKLVLDAQLELDLSSGKAFKPVSLAPDLWYGVTDDITLGLVHSTLGETGFIGTTGDGLCLTGSSSGCPHVYNNVGIDGRIRIKRPLALDVGLYVKSFADPFQPDAKIGIDGRCAWDKISLELQPSFIIGLTNRAPEDAMNKPIPSEDNSEFLFIPATAAYRVVPKADLALQVGLALPFVNTSNTWAVPISIAARFAATPKLGIGLAFTFKDLIGGASSSGDRSLTLGGTYAF